MLHARFVAPESLRSGTGSRIAFRFWQRLNSRLFLLQEFTMPKFENGKVENFLGIPAGGSVVGKHFFDSTFVEIAASHGFGIEEEVVDPVLELATKPCFIGNGKSGLFALQNFARHATAES